MTAAGLAEAKVEHRRVEESAASVPPSPSKGGMPGLGCDKAWPHSSQPLLVFFTPAVVAVAVVAVFCSRWPYFCIPRVVSVFPDGFRIPAQVVSVFSGNVRVSVFPPR